MYWNEYNEILYWNEFQTKFKQSVIFLPHQSAIELEPRKDWQWSVPVLELWREVLLAASNEE